MTSAIGKSADTWGGWSVYPEDDFGASVTPLPMLRYLLMESTNVLEEITEKRVKSKNNKYNDVHDKEWKLWYLIDDKPRDVNDAVDKVSKTFLVKMERVFSHKIMMMLINHYLLQTKLFW